MTGPSRRASTVAVLLVAAMVVVIATVPLRLVAARVLAADGGIGAVDARGTPWRGTLRGVTVHGAIVSNVDVRLRAVPLLLGRSVLVLRGDRLQAQLLHGARVGIAHATGTLDLPAPPGLPGARVTLALADASLVFSGSSCRIGSGTVALTLLLPDPALPVLRMTGPASCVAGHGRVALMAETGEVGAVLHLAADGRWRVQATASAPAPGLRLALQLAGFREVDAGLQREWEGRLTD